MLRHLGTRMHRKERHGRAGCMAAFLFCRTAAFLFVLDALKRPGLPDGAMGIVLLVGLFFFGSGFCHVFSLFSPSSVWTFCRLAANPWGPGCLRSFAAPSIRRSVGCAVEIYCFSTKSSSAGDVARPSSLPRSFNYEVIRDLCSVPAPCYAVVIARPTKRT